MSIIIFIEHNNSYLKGEEKKKSKIFLKCSLTVEKQNRIINDGMDNLFCTVIKQEKLGTSYSQAIDMWPKIGNLSTTSLLS